MLTIEKVLCELQKKKRLLDESRVRDAFFLASELHKDQMRKTGEPYISHPLAVAFYLAEYGADEDTIIAALLHDTVEDTHLTQKELETRFGKEVAQLVRGVTKISEGALRQKKDLDQKIESFRRWFQIMQEDIRVAIIKLFDRLHNLETLEGHKNLQKRKGIAFESIFIYSRIAKKLSINRLADRLVEISFPYAFPKITEIFNDILKKREQVAKKIEKDIQQQLFSFDEKKRIQDVRYLPVPLIKMKRGEIQKKKDISRIIAHTFVLTTKTIEDCYFVLYLIHSLWKTKDYSFVDRINSPSASGAQELRTTVLYREGINVSFNIRTREMDEYHDKGVTLFCFQNKGIEKNLLWIQYLEYVTSIDKENSQMFFDKLQNDVLGPSMVVYTDVDERVLLPTNSTILDAAFYLFGKQAVNLEKAYINGVSTTLGKRVHEKDTLRFELKKEKMIKEDWIKHANTALALSMIKKEYPHGI